MHDDDRMETATLDPNGHFARTETMAPADMPSWLRRDLRQASLFGRMAEAMAELPEDKQVPMDDLGGLTCPVCGRRDLKFAAVDEGANRVTEPCAYPGGMPVYDVVIAVPSGRIAFANDLRRLCPVDMPRGRENSEHHMRLQVEAYARGGMGHVFVGNSCPDVWKVSPTELRVANYLAPEDLDDDDEMPEGPVTPVGERGERQGAICTDLWWFSAMDANLLAERCRSIGQDPAAWVDFTVEVEPGNYAFSVERVNRDSATEVFSVITRTDRPAVPVVLRDTTVSQTLKGSQAWAEMEGLADMFPGFAALDFLFLTSGNGYRWRDGLLCDGTGEDSHPFRKLAFHEDKTPERHPLADAVAPWEGFHVGRNDTRLRGPGEGEFRTLGDVGLGFNAISTTPGDADPWWLAAGILFARSALATPRLFVDDRRGTGADRAKAMGQLLHYLLEIVETRGGLPFIQPYLDAWREAGPELAAA